MLNYVSYVYSDKFVIVQYVLKLSYYYPYVCVIQPSGCHFLIN